MGSIAGVKGTESPRGKAMDEMKVELTLEELLCAHSGLSALLTVMMDEDHAYLIGTKVWDERIDLVVKTMDKLARTHQKHRVHMTESHSYWHRIARQ